MTQKDLKNLTKLVAATGKYKPENRPKKPEVQPSVKQLNEVYKLNLKIMKIDVE